jgi:hypothetical protein
VVRISRGRPPPRLRRLPPVTSAGRAARALVGRAGFDLVRRTFYSPIPDLEALPTEVWTRQSDLPAVNFHVQAGLEFVKRELADYVAEYAPPRQPTGDPRDYYLDNDLYESGDAELLYAMIRYAEPRRVIELGSGMSTLVIADALSAGEDGDEARHLIYDPYPRPELRETFESLGELHAVSANDVPIEEFEQLGEGDVLFVDTTHTVKIGSEVNRIILEVLPRLASGVLVHIHDIYLPWEYPREFMEERRFFWNEQYLLQAFLAFNREFEVLFGTQALARRFPSELKALLPSRSLGSYPSAFWIRRTVRGAR